MTAGQEELVAPTAPPLVYGVVSLDDVRTEVHTSDACPNASITMWLDARHAPAGMTVQELVALLIRQDLVEDREPSLLLKVCRCTITGNPEPREPDL